MVQIIHFIKYSYKSSSLSFFLNEYPFPLDIIQVYQSLSVSVLVPKACLILFDCISKNLYGSIQNVKIQCFLKIIKLWKLFTTQL